jgi:ferritin-like metal-binding protein YciE
MNSFGLKGGNNGRQEGQNEDLKAAFEKHEGETEEQVARLQRVFEAIEKTPGGRLHDLKGCPSSEILRQEAA